MNEESRPMCPRPPRDRKESRDRLATRASLADPANRACPAEKEMMASLDLTDVPDMMGKKERKAVWA